MCFEEFTSGDVLTAYGTKRVWYTNGLKLSERKSYCVHQGEPRVVQPTPLIWSLPGMLLEQNCWFSFPQKNPRSAKSLCEARQHGMNGGDKGIFVSSSLTAKLTIILNHVVNIDFALETLSLRTKYNGVTVKYQ